MKFISEREKQKYFHSLEGEEKYDALNRILKESEHIVFLGGAGVSTESGIPDFRGKNGLYKKKDREFRRYKPEYLLGIDCLEREPEVFFSYMRKNLDSRGAMPNAAHEKLAEMERNLRRWRRPAGSTGSSRRTSTGCTRKPGAAAWRRSTEACCGVTV